MNRLKSANTIKIISTKSLKEEAARFAASPAVKRKNEEAREFIKKHPLPKDF